VVSEWAKPRPDANVVRWLAELDEDSAYISVVAFAEIRHGIAKLPAGRRRNHLESWLREELSARFEGRILGVGLAIADACGVFVARSEKSGINLNVMDAFVAATAKIHSLTLATRNVKHFTRLGISLVNPWNAASNSTLGEH